jgi:hypothetical protein
MVLSDVAENVGTGLDGALLAHGDATDKGIVEEGGIDGAAAELLDGTEEEYGVDVVGQQGGATIGAGCGGVVVDPMVFAEGDDVVGAEFVDDVVRGGLPVGGDVGGEGLGFVGRLIRLCLRVAGEEDERQNEN